MSSIATATKDTGWGDPNCPAKAGGFYRPLVFLIALLAGAAPVFSQQTGALTQQELETLRGELGAMTSAVSSAGDISIEDLVALLERGNGRELYQETKDLAESALKRFTDNAHIYNEYGVACYNLGEVKDAREAFEKAVSLDGEYSEPHVNLAVLYRCKGWYDRAEEENRLALDLEPNDGIAWYDLGITLLRLSRNDEAMECFQKAIANQPDNAPPYREVAVLLINQEKYSDALPYLRKFVELDPNSKPFADKLIQQIENMVSGGGK
jgi:tetratricopeptide (TPR) repeat protein